MSSRFLHRYGRLSKRAALFCAMLLLVSCASLPRNPLPEQYVEQTQIPGLPDVRTFADEYSPAFQKNLVESIERRKAYYEAQGLVWPPQEPINLLALSGGGDYGAFGAGVLYGWTEAGDRPEFSLVTGVSTGSLIAPFAFLGSDYDDELKEVYTTIDAKKVFILKRIFSIIGGDSVADTKPLAELAATYIDGEMLRRIADEHDKGRRLFIATTNLDAQRSVVWDMGAIAKAGRLELFRKVLMASSAIPAAFPPEYIPVVAGGKVYDEMHVDGGVVTQVFLYGPFVNPMSVVENYSDDFNGRDKRMYVIVNNKVSGTYNPLRRNLPDIAGAAISSLIRNQGIGALDRLYLIAERDGFDYNVGYIPDEFQPQSDELFDPEVMNTLFEMGREMVREGSLWMNHPPGFTP